MQRDEWNQRDVDIAPMPVSSLASGKWWWSEKLNCDCVRTTREKLFLNLWTSLRWSNTSGNNVNTFMNINRFQRASTDAHTHINFQIRPKIESFLLTSWGGILCRPHFNHPSTPSSCCSAHHRRDCLKNSLNFANINLSLPPTHIAAAAAASWWW